MNLTSPSQVKAWCIENEFHPNRVLGQNFLIDRNALEAIVDAGLGPCADGGSGAPQVLEIGPGLGVLTEELLKRGCRVTAVEKDPVLAARLKESLGSPEGLTVVAGDALDWVAASPIAAGAFSCMVSNLPYQAGTRILLELAMTRALPSMTVLVQTEVAERLGAARLRRAHRAQGVRQLLLAASGGRLERRPPGPARPEPVPVRGGAPALSPPDEAGVRTPAQATWQRLQGFGTIYGKGRRARERRVDRTNERTDG